MDASDRSSREAAADNAAKGLRVSFIVLPHPQSASVANAIRDLTHTLSATGCDFEIIAPAMNGAGRSLSYGAALRAGVAQASKEYVAIVDAGTRLEPADIERMAMVVPRCGLVCGLRADRRERWLRRLASGIYSRTADLFLGTQVEDCTGAVKLLRRDTFLQLNPTSNSRFIHAELVARARQQSLQLVALDVSQRGAAPQRFTRPLHDVVGTLREMVSFWWNAVLFPGGDSSAAGAPSAAGAVSEKSSVVVRPWHVLLLAVVAAFMLFTRLNFSLIEPDEARYALIAAQMLDSGDMVIPMREGAYYLDKPPLLYWLTLASYCVLGVHGYAARVVPAGAAFGTVMAVYFIGRRLVGARGALLGAYMLLMSLGFMMAGRFLLMDGLLTLFTTVSLLALYVAVQGPRLRPGWWLFGAAACGLGVMTKGPVALVLTLPPLIVARWFATERARKSTSSESSRVPKSVGSATASVAPIPLWAWVTFGATITAIALPWFVAATLRDPGFLKYFFWDHHVKRFTTDFNHTEPWWFYLPAMVPGMFPASFLLPVLALYLLRRAPVLAGCRTPAQGYLLLSGAWVVAFFSISSGKLVTYILPSLPPLALLLGAMLDVAVLSDVPDAFMQRMRRWIPYHGTRIALITGVGVGIANFVVDRSPSARWLESGLLIVGSVVLYWYVSRPQFASRPARWWAAAGIPLAILAFGMIDIYPTIATQRSLASQVAEFRHARGAAAPIVCYGRYEDSLIFYNRDTEIHLFNIEQTDELVAFLAAHADVLLLSQDDYIGPLQARLPASVALDEQPESRGKLYVASSHPSQGANEISTKPGDARR